ncbi:hypothetical protein [Enterobacter cloacae]|uniref:hypothetical protein n=1 Tax=Enterobacter cloacae TaxID=550 RepID=UPI003F445932
MDKFEIDIFFTRLFQVIPADMLGDAQRVKNIAKVHVDFLNKFPEPMHDHALNSGLTSTEYFVGFQSGRNLCIQEIANILGEEHVSCHLPSDCVCTCWFCAKRLIDPKR